MATEIVKLWNIREEEACAVDAAFADAELKRGGFLLKYGWDYSCSFPDSNWRYVKTVKGQSLCLAEHDAFNMERKFIEPKQP